MLCELCDGRFEPGEKVVPVGLYSSLLGALDITTGHRGIHLSCLKEIVESLRSFGELLTTSQPRTMIVNEHIAPTESTLDNG